MRIFDPRGAEVIQIQYLEPLRLWFDSAMRNADSKDVLDREGMLDKAKRMRQLSSSTWSNEIKPGMPPTPPGLGFDALGFDEAAPTSPLAVHSHCRSSGNKNQPSGIASCCLQPLIDGHDMLTIAR